MALLIAEKNSEYSRLMAEMAEHLGLASVVAADGEQALEQLIDNPDVSIVFAEIELPKMSGIELLRLMKEDPRLKEVPVVILSQTAKLTEICEAIELGAARFLPKPFDPRHVERFLRELSK
jgi:CheY-like chemotaxis protein